MPIHSWIYRFLSHLNTRQSWLLLQQLRPEPTPYSLSPSAMQERVGTLAIDAGFFRKRKWLSCLWNTLATIRHEIRRNCGSFWKRGAFLWERLIDGMGSDKMSWNDSCWMDAWLAGWAGGRLAGWMAGWMDGWLAAWLDGWLDGWMDGWMDDHDDVDVDLDVEVYVHHEVPRAVCFWTYDLCIPLLSFAVFYLWESTCQLAGTRAKQAAVQQDAERLPV